MKPKPQELTTYFALLNNDINGEFSFTPYASALTASLGFSEVTAYDRLFFKVNRRILACDGLRRQICGFILGDYNLI